ncbi:hypothetical protein D9M71_679410 [compost metagenome]
MNQGISQGMEGHDVWNTTRTQFLELLAHVFRSLAVEGQKQHFMRLHATVLLKKQEATNQRGGLTTPGTGHYANIAFNRGDGRQLFVIWQRTYTASLEPVADERLP